VGCTLAVVEKRLVVSKVGHIKVLLHRPLEGVPKTATIRRTATGKWFVTFSCEWEPMSLPPTAREVGLDVGLTVFAMPSVGDPIMNPRFFRSEERALAKAPRKHQVALDAHKTSRSSLTAQIQAAQPHLDELEVWRLVSQQADERLAWRERQHRRKVLAQIHERIRWRRSNFAHQASRQLVDIYDVLAVEDLSVRKMVKNHALAKSIHDAAWTQFAAVLRYKAEWAGRRYVPVDPKHTSTSCSACGSLNPALTLADRVFHCLNPARPDRRLVLDRDRNAARNI
jgi:putative transposase